MLAVGSVTPAASQVLAQGRDGPVGAPVVTAIRIGEYPAKTRLVLDLTGRLGFRVFALADPYRVVIDLPEVSWRLGRTASARRGLVTALRYGLFKRGNSRVVVDVSGPVRVAKSFLLAPGGQGGYRLVVDLAMVPRDVMLRRLKARRPAPGTKARRQPERIKPAPRDPKTKTRRKGRPVIAIDPGHGGVDPGAIGISGINEKYITLAHARELRRQLKGSDRYRVILTRNRDVFIRLRDRIAIARRANADLFISLHADSTKNRRIRGGAVYTLSETASDKEAAELAAKENRADLIAGIDLSDQSEMVAKILIDLRQRLTKNDSVIFAKGLVRELGTTTRMLRNNHRFAGFAVLKAPEVPSVLIEMGYLSNSTDERLLRHSRHRQKLSAAIVKAVGRYFSRQQALRQP